MISGEISSAQLTTLPAIDEARKICDDNVRVVKLRQRLASLMSGEISSAQLTTLPAIDEARKICDDNDRVVKLRQTCVLDVCKCC